MDQENDYTPPGCCRVQRSFLRDYHQRAYWIAQLQLILAVLYLSAAVVEVEWILTSTSYRTSAQVAELWFWLVVNYLRALLHIFSSVLIMLVSFEGPQRKILVIRNCNWAKLMNQSFFLYEIIVLVFMYQYWELAFYYALYRLWFNYELSGLLNTVRILSPPPPGHYC